MKSLESRFFGIYGISVAITAILTAFVGIGMGPAALLTFIILIVIEVTFSVDCAVINAQVLRGMDAFWQRMFRTAGIFIAVFGVRFVFPLIIVGTAAGLSIGDTFWLALQHPADYAAKLHAANPYIAMLGGSFLLMVFLDYALGQAHLNPLSGIVRHWHMRGLRRYVQLGFVLGAMALVVLAASAEQRLGLSVAGATGVAMYAAARGLVSWFSARHKIHKHTSQSLARGGMVAFLYLEMLDASFSFDSVIGAFAVTNNIVLIAAGLGVGAVWVRSFTIDLLRKGTLRHYPYLGLGANLAIGALAILLFIEVNTTVPELLTGVIGFAIIIIAFAASVVHNRRAVATGASVHITLHSHRQ